MDNVTEYTSSKTNEVYPVGGCIISNRQSNVSLLAAAPVQRKKLPPKVDLRCFTPPVQHQGRSNTCTANAVAGAYACLMKRITGNDIAVSRLFIYYNARRRHKRNHNRINNSGTQIKNVVQGMRKYGCCKENVWEYRLGSVNRKPSKKAYSIAKNHCVTKSKRLPTDLKEMKYCLSIGCPFTFGLHLFQSFKSAESNGGRVRTPKFNEPELQKHSWHALVAVGYSDRSKCFIVRNSWGTKWGDGGYCYIPYKYMSNRKHCQDVQVILAVSKKSHQPKKSGSTNPKQFQSKTFVRADYKEKHADAKDVFNKEVQKPNLDDDRNDEEDKDTDSDLSDEDDKDTGSEDEFNDEEDTDADPKEFFVNREDLWKTDDDYNYYFQCKSTTNPDDFVVQKKCDGDRSDFSNYILWIDPQTDLKESVERQLMANNTIKFNCFKKISEAVDYIIHNEDHICPTMYQIVCLAYYRDEKRSALDLLEILDCFQLDDVPISIITRQKAAVESHLNNEAPTKDIDDWKKRIFLTDKVEELLTRLKQNIAHGK